MILILGDVRWRGGSGPRGEPDPRIVRLPLGALSVALLARLRPELIVVPIRAEGYDVIDVAERLASLGYRGRLRAVTRPLPHPDLVREEVAEVAPDLDFDLLIQSDRRVH